jgi:glycosyltransferase involved in cell wall biosynthesis
MSQPLVSVIIPSYNYGQYVGQAVESALAQTYSNVEVIVVDDGSQDDTRLRLAHYGDRIRYVYQENQGLSAARNTGIREAQGDYVAFLDSDDAAHPRKLELQLAYLMKHPEVDLIASEMVSDEPIQWIDVGNSELPATVISLEAMAIKPRFAPSSVVAHKKCFAAVGTFDTALRSVEDREMWLRIATQFTMARIDLPLTWYRITPGSMSTNPERMEHFELLVLSRAFAFPQLRDNKRAHRLALSHCYRSSAYTFYSVGRYREALGRLWLSIKYWPFGYEKNDQVPAFYRTRLLIGTLKRWLFQLKPSMPNGAVASGRTS